MKYLSLLLILIWSSQASPSPSVAPPSFETHYITQPLDHFSYISTDTITLRYLINNDNCNSSSSCPVLFYCGGEDDITAFANATGFLWDLSQKLQALLVYAEHRYYGKSLPITKENNPNLPAFSHLTSQQAMADFASLGSSLNVPSLTDSTTPGKRTIIATGGSYGGMLAAWLRVSYPHVFSGALASSAPVLYLNPEVNTPDAFYSVVNNNYSPKYRGKIRQAFEDLLELILAGKFEQIKEELGLCEAPGSAQQARNTVAWLQQGFGVLSELDYPYPTSFLHSLPANPINVSCALFDEAGGGIAGLSAAVSLVGDGDKCVDVDLTEWWAFAPGFIPGPWTYQRCTDLVMPVATPNDPTRKPARATRATVSVSSSTHTGLFHMFEF